MRDIREFELEPDPVIEAYKKDVDRTLLRENLKLTVSERILKAQRLVAAQTELRAAALRAREARHRHGS